MRALLLFALVLLVGCSVALAQTAPPASVAADPVATLVGAGGFGTAAATGAGWWLGAKFERFMTSFDKAIEVMKEVRDALKALVEDDVAERPRRPRRTTAAS